MSNNPFLQRVLRREHWMTDALCAQFDVGDLFFGEGDKATTRRHNQLAKAVCARCPVRRECLEYAITNREPFGVWGGLTEHQRRELHPGRTPADERTHCPNGHDLAEVGRRTNGYCRQCDRDRSRRYNERSKQGLTGKKTR